MMALFSRICRHLGLSAKLSKGKNPTGQTLLGNFGHFCNVISKDPFRLNADQIMTRRFYQLPECNVTNFITKRLGNSLLLLA